MNIQSLQLPSTFLSSPNLLAPESSDSGVRNNPKFQLNTKSIALTYPDWLLPRFDHDYLLQRIRVHLEEFKPSQIVIGREQHKSGNWHFHLAIKCHYPVRTRNCRFFDIDSQHANVQSTKNWAAWVRYCKKSDDWEEWFDPANGGAQTTKKEPISPELVINNAKSMTKLEFITWMSINKLTYAPMIWDNAHRDATITLTQETIIQGILNPKFEKLITEVNWVEEKCLVLIGDSGIGKTTYAKRIIPKPALFISHIDDLKKFEPDYHKSILFDDVCFTHYPLQAQIHLVDNENPRSIHIRYGTARIPQGTYKIFTCNEQPVDLSKAPIRRRCQVIRCDVVALQNF